MTSFHKTPEIIDAELEVAYSERRALRFSILGLTSILFILVVTLVVLVRANTGLFPRHKIVYSTNAAAVCAFQPVNERGPVTGAIIENFAVRIALDLHQLDYVNFRSTLARVMDAHFTPDARSATTVAMLQSGILRAVTQQGFVIRALPRDRPTVLREGVEEGIYTWVVRVPLTIAYAHRSEANSPTFRPEERDIYMTVVRVEPSAANPLGLLVSRLLALQPTESLDIETFSPSGPDASTADASVDTTAATAPADAAAPRP